MNFETLEQAAFTFYDSGSQLRDHVYSRSREYFQKGRMERLAIATRAQIQQRQAELKAFFIEAIGGLPKMDSALNAVKTGVLHGEGFDVEKIILESRPHHYVTGSLYLPHRLPAPSAAVLFVCGHHALARLEDEYQHVCQTLVQAGLIVFAIDPIGQGERLSYTDETGGPLIGPATADHDHAGAQCVPLGESLARYFLHDNMRALDYLCSRPEVDAARIGVTGNSGGGTQTAMLMMTDTRVAAAAPGTFLMNREDFQKTGIPQDAEQIWPGFSQAGYDHEDILLAMAPRPVLVLAVTEDFFPVEATRKTVQNATRFWDICGAPGNLQIAEDEGLHAYTPKLAMAAADFFSRHLLGRNEKPASPSRPRPFSKNELQSTQSGQIARDFPEARFVFDTITARAAHMLGEQKSPEERREAAHKEIDRRVHTGRTPCALAPRTYDRGECNELLYEKIFWFNQPELLGHGVLFRSQSPSKHRLPVTIGIWEGGSHRLAAHEDWIQQECAEGRSVFVLDVSGEGACTCHPICGDMPYRGFAGVIRKLADDLIFLGDDLPSLRAHQVLKALELLGARRDLDDQEVKIKTEGYHAIHALMAGFLARQVTEVESDGASYGELLSRRYYDSRDIKSFLVPGLLHFCDLTDLTKWIMERKSS